LLALIILIFGAGVLVMLLPRGSSTVADQVAGGDSALAVARDRVDRADNLAQSDPQQSLAYYREAWREVQEARGTGLSGSTLDDLEGRVRAGLDAQYGARQPQTTAIQLFSGERDPRGLQQGPDGAAYFIDGKTIVRVDTTTGEAVTVVTEGDKAAGGGARIGRPVQLESGGPDIIIVDDAATAWRWRPSDDTGRGTLARLNFIGDTEWGVDHGDVEAFDDPNGYRLYVVEPSLNQILRYQPTFDRSSFSPPTDYLYAGGDEVSRIRELYIDFDLYALVTGDAGSENDVHKYESGRFNGLFTLARPPDEADLRPGFDWVAVTGTGTDAGGRLYLYDAKWDRIVAFDKTNGAYLGQWQPGPEVPPWPTSAACTSCAARRRTTRTHSTG
jgi:hypothetical protein